MKNGPKSSRLVEPRPGVGQGVVEPGPDVTEPAPTPDSSQNSRRPTRPWPGVGHGDENVTRLPQSFRSVDTPGGARTRSFRIESPASSPVRPRGQARSSDGRDRTCVSRLTVACLTARPHRNVRRKEGESNPQGRGPPVFETGYRARWQSFQQMTPAGLEPARPRLRVGRSTELSYGARDVVGRARTCNAPRFRRALYLH